MFRLLRYTLFLVILSACTAPFKVSDTKAVHYDLKSFNSDSMTVLSVSPYKEKLDREMTKVIAYSDSALTREGFEPLVGNFVLMAMQEFMNEKYPAAASGCVLFMNRGGLRNNLPKGEITTGNIFELMPFENEIAIITIRGDKLQEAIRYMLKDKKLISLQLSLKAKNNEPDEIAVYNTPFDANKNYTVITTDYLALGGDNCSFFAKPVSYIETKTKLRDVMIGYCETLTKTNRHIKPARFNAIQIIK